MRYPGILVALLAVSLLAPSSAAAARSEFFGMTHERQLDPQDFQKLGAARIRTQRLLFHWPTLQPSPGAIAWGATDQLVGRLASHGIRSMPFLWGSPEWVAGSQATPPLGSTADRGAWKSFLAAVVARYGRGGNYWTNRYPQQFGASATPLPIKSWQIWNEPNMSKFFAPSPSPGKYAELLRISRSAIKSRDPQAQIVLAGMLGYANPKSWDFLDALYAIEGVKNIFDAAALHPYGSTIDKVQNALHQFRRVMTEHGDGGTPLWVTEVGWGSNPPDQFGMNKGPEGQKNLLRKTFQLVLNNRTAWNVQRLFWYFWRDPATHMPGTCNFCSSSGLLRNDHTPKPAYATFRGFAAETDPPQARITAGPSAGSSTNNPSPSFTFVSDEPGSTFVCRLNASAFKSCSSPHTLAPLTDGAHTFRVKAIDAPGNESPVVSRTFTVDTQPPAAPRITDTDPNSPANDNTPKVKGTAAAGSIVWLYKNATCAGSPIGASSAATFASPGITVSVADNTTTSFRARARDAAGNLSPCSSPFAYVEVSTLAQTTIAFRAPLDHQRQADLRTFLQPA